jgi:hypothetical protein
VSNEETDAAVETMRTRPAGPAGQPSKNPDRRRLLNFAASGAAAVGFVSADTVTTTSTVAATAHPLAGTWYVEATYPHGGAPPGIPVDQSLFAFHTDGIVTQVNRATLYTGIGQWASRDGQNTFTYVFRQMLFTPAFEGFIHVVQTGTVTGDRYTSTGSGTLFDPAGKAAGSPVATSLTGTRFGVVDT